MVDQGGLSQQADDLANRVVAALPEGRLVVAISGGADSAVLAWAVSRRREVRAVSVDHHLSGSARLMEAASEIATRLGIPHEVVGAAPSNNTETGLRETRLVALEGAATAAESILTGHTLDDQAETVLGNVLRGAGASGLAGIPIARDRFVRPMLGERREAVRAVAEYLRLPFVDDPQNSDLEIRRNRLRIETIPQLTRGYNPRLVEALGRLAAHGGDDEAILAARAARVPLYRRGGAVLIPAAALETLPRAIATRVVRAALRLGRGPHPGSNREVAAVLATTDGSASTIGGGILVEREGPWVALIIEPPQIPAPVEIVPGVQATLGEWMFEVGDAAPTVGRFAVSIVRPQHLFVRAARADETIAIGRGSKRVGDALAEVGVPSRMRSTWPVLTADEAIVWVVGVRAAPGDGAPPTITVRARRDA